MRTAEAEANDYVCPAEDCHGDLAQDTVGQGYVRHKHRKSDGTLCTYGHGERDEAR